jgi:sugar lactone lactonase YvrE
MKLPETTYGRRLMAFFFCVLLAACGGSGSSDTTTLSGQGSSTGQPVAQSGSGQPSGNDTGNTGNTGNKPPESDGVTATTTFPDARFFNPIGIAFDSKNNLFVADTGNSTIRKISGRSVTTFAGTAGERGAVDAQGAAARFSFPVGIAIDRKDNLYVTDDHTIRKITPDGTVTTLAGAAGQPGYADGTGAEARFDLPWGLAIDEDSNVFVGDSNNHVIRKITPEGVVTTFAGNVETRGIIDGPADEAFFLNPRGLAFDRAGNLYVTDWFGPEGPRLLEGSSVIRRVAPDGEVTTIAGRFRPELEPAPFANAFGIATDPDGNVYLVQAGSIHRVTPTGEITTVVTSPMLGGLQALARHPDDGDWYVADSTLHVIWRVMEEGDISLLAGGTGEAGSNDSAP